MSQQNGTKQSFAKFKIKYCQFEDVNLDALRGHASHLEFQTRIQESGQESVCFITPGPPSDCISFNHTFIQQSVTIIVQKLCPETELSNFLKKLHSGQGFHFFPLTKFLKKLHSGQGFPLFFL